MLKSSIKNLDLSYETGFNYINSLFHLQAIVRRGRQSGHLQAMRNYICNSLGYKLNF
jgi:hypothetical protein